MFIWLWVSICCFVLIVLLLDLLLLVIVYYFCDLCSSCLLCLLFDCVWQIARLYFWLGLWLLLAFTSSGFWLVVLTDLVYLCWFGSRLLLVFLLLLIWFAWIVMFVWFVIVCRFCVWVDVCLWDFCCYFVLIGFKVFSLVCIVLVGSLGGLDSCVWF